MTRRLTITMVAVVAGALLVAGFGSLFLIRAQSRRDTVADLRKQAQGIAQLVDEIPARLPEIEDAKTLAGLLLYLSKR